MVTFHAYRLVKARLPEAGMDDCGTLHSLHVFFSPGDGAHECNRDLALHRGAWKSLKCNC